MSERPFGPRDLEMVARRGTAAGVMGKEYRSWEMLTLVKSGMGMEFTLTALPAFLYSRRRGRTLSASRIVETMMFTGPVPLPTWRRVSSVVWI